MKEYLADGYNVIWSHGSQYFEATSKLAKQNPDVTFIGEFDNKPKESVPSTRGSLDRNFHVAFYPIGVLAVATTKSGKIGYVGGLSLPFSYSEALNQALKDTASATVNPVWIGDFNDPAKAQQITTQLIGQGNDVIVGPLNLGMVGAFQATKGKAADVRVTAKYTDKSQFDPEHYATSTIYDFTQAAGRDADQDRGRDHLGLLPRWALDSGVSIQPLKNASRGREQGREGRGRHQVRRHHGREEPHPDQVTRHEAMTSVDATSPALAQGSSGPLLRWRGSARPSAPWWRSAAWTSPSAAARSTACSAATAPARPR